MIGLRFFGGTGMTSRAIEWFSGGYFSHVAALWTPTQLLDSHADKIAGVRPGVRVRLASTETADVVVDMELAATPSQLTRWRNFLAAQLGKPYDKPAIWGFALGRDWRAPDSWFCSELQAAALEACEVCPKLYTPNNKVTPVALANVVSALGGRIADLPVLKSA